MAARAAEAGWPFTKRVLIVLGLSAVFIIGALTLYTAARVFAVIFMGVLVAVLLDGLSELLQRATRVPRGWSMALICLAAGGLIVGGGWIMANKVVDQFDNFVSQVRSAGHEATARLQQSEWGRQLLNMTPLSGDGAEDRALVGRVTGAFSSALGGLVDLFVITFLGIYFAAQPDRYVHGLMHLIPLRARKRGGEVLGAVGVTLRWWMLGRVVNMAIVGVLTAIGLWSLGMPMVVPLSLTAFFLDFVPYLGPPLSAVPAVLIAATTDGGGEAAAMVFALYVGVQFVEGYVTQPLIESRAVEMPPALVIIGQIILGLLFGVPGIIIASPLAAVLLVVLKMVYVEDVLGDDAVEVQAERPEHAVRPVPKRAG